jgi:hypothetical protein
VRGPVSSEPQAKNSTERSTRSNVRGFITTHRNRGSSLASLKSKKIPQRKEQRGLRRPENETTLASLFGSPLTMGVLFQKQRTPLKSVPQVLVAGSRQH